MSVPKPDLRDPEYVAFATLWNDLTFANTTDHYIPFSVREKQAKEMWEMGYRPTQERISDGVERQRRTQGTLRSREASHERE